MSVTQPKTEATATWTGAVDSNQATTLVWTPSTAAGGSWTLGNTPAWSSTVGAPVSLGVAIISGAVEFRYTDAASWHSLVSGFSLGASECPRLEFRTANNGTAAVVQITQSRAKS